MFSNLGSKLAMKKLGIPSDPFNFNGGSSKSDNLTPRRGGRRTATAPVENDNNNNDDDDAGPMTWPPKWMTVKKLPLTAQSWLTPAPPPVPIAPSCPGVGDPAPRDREGKLVLGGGRKVIVVFLRCVGCAFAQKTFHALRALSTSHPNLTCLAISQGSPAATNKWVSLLGGAWNVRVIVDEERALYATWGLGTSSVWYYFNPTTQSAAWREKEGWLGAKVAGSVGAGATGEAGAGTGAELGNKWQEGGAWAVDERGVVVWGGKAKTAEEVLDLEEGVRALRL